MYLIRERPSWKKKKRKTSTLVDSGSDNQNEREKNQQHVMNRQERMEKKNTIFGTERYENIDTDKQIKS